MPVRITHSLSYENSSFSYQKHYCDYCDVFLTHDSASGSFHGWKHSTFTHHYIVRKAHNSGRNHLANVRDYYACKHLFALLAPHFLTPFQHSATTKPRTSSIRSPRHTRLEVVPHQEASDLVPNIYLVLILLSPEAPRCRLVVLPGHSVSTSSPSFGRSFHKTSRSTTFPTSNSSARWRTAFPSKWDAPSRCLPRW